MTDQWLLTLLSGRYSLGWTPGCCSKPRQCPVTPNGYVQFQSSPGLLVQLHRSYCTPVTWQALSHVAPRAGQVDATTTFSYCCYPAPAWHSNSSWHQSGLKEHSQPSHSHSNNAAIAHISTHPADAHIEAVHRHGCTWPALTAARLLHTAH
jgi:hypothetical protein